MDEICSEDLNDGGKITGGCETKNIVSLKRRLLIPKFCL